MYFCELCHKRFRFRAIWHHHRSCDHNKPLYSNVSKTASKALLKRSIFMKSMMVLFKQSSCKLSQEYSCTKCVKVFKLRSQMLHHMSIHFKSLLQGYIKLRKKDTSNLNHVALGSEKLVKTKCSKHKVLSNETSLKVHMTASDPEVTLSCHRCSFKTRLRHLLDRHEIEDHRNRIMCKICGRSCARLESLNAHMLLIHKIHNSKIKHKMQQCAEPGCNYVCLYKKRAEEHALKHKETKQYKCDDCGKMFKHKKGLGSHKAVVHEGVRPFICDVCGQSYGQEGELKVHIERHSSIKPHACHLCAYKTQYKANLKSHLFKIHEVVSDQMLVFSCDRCPYITNRRSRFNDHIKKNHEKIVDIPCSVCDKMFSTKQDLYGHVATVHKPKSFQCNYCTYSTGVSTTLKQHVKVMHTQRDVKNYECIVCGFRSATRGNCRKHIQRIHEDPRIAPKFVGNNLL